MDSLWLPALVMPLVVLFGRTLVEIRLGRPRSEASPGSAWPQHRGPRIRYAPSVQPLSPRTRAPALQALVCLFGTEPGKWGPHALLRGSGMHGSLGPESHTALNLGKTELLSFENSGKARKKESGVLILPCCYLFRASSLYFLVFLVKFNCRLRFEESEHQ